MRLLRPTAIIASFLIVAISIPPSLFSQTAPRQHPSRRPQRSDALAPAINELLKLEPLAPESPDEKGSENADAQSKEESKPPADDAPISELLDYWRNHDTTSTKPSDKIRRRLLEACEDDPDSLSGSMDLLPENSDTHDRLYKMLQEEPDDASWKSNLRNWLQLNSGYFRDDLIAEARGEGMSGNSQKDSLTALARLDWETAKPILEALASAWNTEMTPVALSLLYERARQDGDSAQTEKYRALLKAIVVNRQSRQDARQTALLSLAGAEWDGQEDWVVSLFADPTLSGLKEETGSGEKSENVAIDEDINVLPNTLFFLPSVYPERWFPVISNLVGERQRAVHLSAVKCLADHLDRESTEEKWKKQIAQKLAPWLTDPDWAATEGRSSFIRSLSNIQTPELVPGLIWILEHDEDQDNRATAAGALIQYRDQRAIPALRRTLEKEEDETRRDSIVTALAQCGGFSDDEMAEAVEAYAKMIVTESGKEEIEQAESDATEKPLQLKVSIGRILSESETVEATEGLALRLIERAKSLRASQPAVAHQILRSIQGVSLRVVEINLVERIGAGWGGIDALKIALGYRDSMRKSAGNELYDLIKQGGYAAGIAAAILNDEREHRETLAGTDTKAQLALLAGARYLRDKLPVELAGKLLNSPNRALSKASESYLEVEDSAEARKLVLARHRGEAHILGDLTPLGHEHNVEAARKWEEKMRKEIRSAAGVEAIYGLARRNSAENFNGVIIRVRGGKAEISVYDVEGRRDVRALTESEIEDLKSFTSRQEVEDMGPETYDDNPERMKFEYLRLTKDSGRRIILDGLRGLRRAPKNPTLHEELSGLFYRLSKSGEFITRYAIEDKIPGVEVLLADKKQEAMMVCGEGREIRVLIGEKGAEYRRGFAETLPEWRDFSSGAPGRVTDEPSTCRVLGSIPMWMKSMRDGNVGLYSVPTWSGAAWIYASLGEDSGVWKLEPGGNPAKIVSGSYVHPVLTADGKWLVAIKTVNEEGKYSPQPVRHNMQTGKEFPVTMPNGGYHPPVTYVAAHGKVLLASAGHHGEAFLGNVNYLLDPETGTVQQMKGEFEPLSEGPARELQSTENPNEFWAAISNENRKVTRFGRYDSMKFAFTPLVELSGLTLNSRDFWVDATAGKIWFTYRGHLLRIPLPQIPKSK